MEDQVIIKEESHYSYHVKDGRLVMMTDEELADSLSNRIKKMIKLKFGVNDIQNKGRLFGVTRENVFQALSLEQIIGVALELGITQEEIETDTSLFHVVALDESNHTFCIHDFETNQRTIFDDFAAIIVKLFELEINTVAPVILSNCHNSYLNEGIIFVLYDEKNGPTSQAIEKENPLYEEVMTTYY
jgi:hypothetical protein